MWRHGHSVATGEQGHVTDLTQGPIFHQLLYFSLPLLLGNLFQQLYNAVDFLIVGQVCGNTAQAAVSASTSVVNLLISATQGFAVGASVVVSRNFGAKDYPRMARSAHTAVVVGAGLGVFVVAVSLLLSRQILLWMSTPQQVMPEAAGYFQVFSVGLFFMVMYNMGSSLFRAVGDNRRPLYYLILAVILNIGLDLIFVAVLDMGVRGAALATVIAQGCAAGGEFLVLFRTRELYRLRLDQLRIDWGQIGDIIRCALPSSLQNCVVSLSNVVVQSYVNQFGQLAMAGFGAYNKLGSFAVLPAVSTSLSLTTFTSQNLGAGDQKRAGRGVWYGVAMISGVTAFFSVVITVFAPQLIGLFNPDPVVIRYGVSMARRVAPFLVLLGFSHALTGALRGAGRAKVPMIVLLLTWCMARVIWISLLCGLWNDIRVVYWGYPVTWLMSSVCLLICFRRLPWSCPVKE